MRYERLKWIAKAIEYDMLTNSESAFLFKLIEDFTQGKLMAKTSEEKLEELFAKVQWREIETKNSYEIWSKKQQENKEKESVPIQSSIPNATVSRESEPGALS